MSSLSCIQHDNCSIYYIADICEHLLLPRPSLDWFDIDHLLTDFTVTGQATGRGTTWFLRYQECDLVLRHYRRGGAIAQLSKDQFIYMGAAKTRPVRELTLLAKLQQWQLPAPTPVAGLVTRNGLTWQGDLITAKIKGAEDVHTILQHRPLTTIEWRHIGATIQRFHQRQVFHHDLNIHNIMLDSEGQAWLIDFDKCAIKQGKRWKKANLDRLLRSLRKESHKNLNYGFKEQNWPSLLAGYRSLTD